jgi:hypothetical protein
MTTAERNQEILRRALAGENYRTIAESFGVTPQYASQVARHHGVPVRPIALGEHAATWRGGRVTTHAGYILVHTPAHPRADSQGYVREHILVAERALGHILPAESEIHHANERKGDNAPHNLVICPNRAYHVLLHQRLRAFNACGKANWRACAHCGRYDDPANLFVSPNRAYHRPCRAADERRRRDEKRRAA